MTISKTIHLQILAGLFGLALCCAHVPASGSDLSIPRSVGNAVQIKWQNFTTRASELAFRAMGMIGIRYKYGGNAPESGLDCSGLVRYVFKEAWGANLPRTSEEISRVGENVDTNDLRPGDLVFYNTLKRSFSHVGIYLGDNKFIHAPSSGGKVRVESMDLTYWKNRFNGARRISEPESQ
jgi:cell wall-associated NlpC family hydrolase